MADAFREDNVAMALAFDVVTASIIAIMALPMIMKLIQVTFLEERNPVRVFIYVLLTDLSSRVSFLIKEIEPIHSDQQQRPVEIGQYGREDVLGLMELW